MECFYVVCNKGDTLRELSINHLNINYKIPLQSNFHYVKYKSKPFFEFFHTFSRNENKNELHQKKATGRQGGRQDTYFSGLNYW